jgi:hypothetical protein
MKLYMQKCLFKHYLIIVKLEIALLSKNTLFKYIMACNYKSFTMSKL